MTFDATGKEKQLMTDASAIYRYIHAAEGEVTLVSPRTMKAHAYVFAEPKNKRDFPEDTIFVYALHNGHKMYLGLMDGSGFRRTQKSNFSEDTEIMKGARYIVKMASRQDVVNQKAMLLYHSGKCCMCGRKLDSDKALAQGIGSKCLKRYNIHLSETPWDGN